jgi:hypothetical protein
MLDRAVTISVVVLLLSIFFAIAVQRREEFEYLSIQQSQKRKKTPPARYYKRSALSFHLNPMIPKSTEFLVLDEGHYLILVHTFPNKGHLILQPGAQQLDSIICVDAESKYIAQIIARSLNLTQVEFQEGQTLEPERVYAITSSNPLLQSDLIKGFVMYERMEPAIVKRFAPFAEIRSVYSADLSRVTSADYLRAIYVPMIATQTSMSGSVETEEIKPAAEEYQTLHKYIFSHSLQMVERFVTTTDSANMLMDRGHFRLIQVDKRNFDLVLGDRVRFNSTDYLVVQVRQDDYICATHLYIDQANASRNQKDGNWYIKFTAPKWFKGDRIYIASINRFGTLSENLIKVDPFLDDTTFNCFTNPIYQSKEACESAYDPIGIPKQKQDIWDAPCQYDVDCPFQGKCMPGGYCEMPLGVEQLSYRTYAAESKPICYSCPIEDTDCCEKQQVPDYSFKGDTMDRMKNGLSIL